jgi:hypothetical protein
MGSGGMIYTSRFMKIGTGVKGILRFCLTNVESCNVGITDRREYSLEMDSCRMIHIQSFMKIGTGVKGILRFCLSILGSCNVGMIDGSDL